MARIRVGNDELEFVRKSDNILELEDGQTNPASIFVDENGKIKFKDRDSTSTFMSTLASLGGNSKLMDAALGPPSNALPPETIVYIDLNDMRLYKRSESGWGTGFGIRGDEGSSGERGKTILYGELNPNSAAMREELSGALLGDMYTEVGTDGNPVHQMWIKINDEPMGVHWEKIGRPYGRIGVDGAQGSRGKTIFEAAPSPDDLYAGHPDAPEGFFQAVEDDLYIETDSHQIWKKTTTGWQPRGQTFRGPAGTPAQRRNSVYQGTENPNNLSMQDDLVDAITGDIYIETDSHRIWKKVRTIGNMWDVRGNSFKGVNGANGQRGRTIYQGTNPTNNPNDLTPSSEGVPSGFFEAEVGDLYIDTEEYQNWKLTGSGARPWIKSGISFRPSGSIQGLIDPNLFDVMTDPTTQLSTYEEYENNLADFTNDWFSVKKARSGDTYIDSNDHILYTKERTGTWKAKGKPFRTNAAIQGLVDPNEFENLLSQPTLKPAVYETLQEYIDDWKAVRDAKIGDTFIDSENHKTYTKRVKTTSSIPSIPRWTTKGKQFRGLQGINGSKGDKGKGHFYGSGTPQDILSKTRGEWVIKSMIPVSLGGFGLSVSAEEAGEDWDDVSTAETGDRYTNVETGATYTKTALGWTSRLKNPFKGIPRKDADGVFRFRGNDGNPIPFNAESVGINDAFFKGKLGTLGVGQYFASLGTETSAPDQSLSNSETSLNLKDVHTDIGEIVTRVGTDDRDFKISKSGFYEIDTQLFFKFKNVGTSQKAVSARVKIYRNATLVAEEISVGVIVPAAVIEPGDDKPTPAYKYITATKNIKVKLTQNDILKITAYSTENDPDITVSLNAVADAEATSSTNGDTFIKIVRLTNR